MQRRNLVTVIWFSSGLALGVGRAVTSDLVQELPDVLVPVVADGGAAMESDGGDVLRLLLQQRAERRPPLGPLQSGVDPLLLFAPPL